MADCLVVPLDQWHQITRAFGMLWLVCIAISVLARFDLDRWEFRIRRFLRARRLARIREANHG